MSAGGRPERVLVAGVSGSGKTTLAARISALTGVPHTEIDALFHGPDWTPRPEFLGDVRALVDTDSWVTEWQYDSARRILAEHAELLIWLDLPFWRITFPRLLRRTVLRRLRREVLWNGNVEPPLHTIFTQRVHVLRWAVATRQKYSEIVPLLASDHPQLVVVRLCSRREVDRWLAELPPQPPTVPK